MTKPIWLYVGTFDPMTKWHHSIAQRMADKYSVRVGIAMNTGKSSAFSLPERLAVSRKEMQGIGMDPLVVNSISWSVARYAKRWGINDVCRGQRNIVDGSEEETLAHFYTLEHPSLQVHTLISDGELKFASSSASKELVRIGHDVRSLVSLSVKEALESRLIRQYPIVLSGSMGSGKSTYARAITAYARSKGLQVTHIDLDAIVHEIYDSLNEPFYVNIRNAIREMFNLPEISGGWIDWKALRTQLLTDPTDPKSALDQEKLKKLGKIVSNAQLFRYRDKIAGVQGIILIDGATVIDNSLSYLSNNHALLVDAPIETRVERVMARYAEKWDRVEESFVRSMISIQTGIPEKRGILGKEIEKEQNGSVSEIENTGSIDPRKTLFRILNQIDRFGELRVSLIFTFLGIQDRHDIMCAELRKLYDAPGRYYHTWEHIIACLTELFEVAMTMDLPDDQIATLGGAILFHDVIYEVTDGKFYQANEKRSAQFASHYLESRGVNPLKSMEVNGLIHETAHGRFPVGENLISRLLHDIDLSVLGSDPEDYRIYGHNVRNELAPMISGQAFENARTEKFLIPTLRTESIYMTGYFQEKYENQARTNLENELQGRISFVPRIYDRKNDIRTDK